MPVDFRKTEKHAYGDNGSGTEHLEEQLQQYNERKNILYKKRNRTER